MAYRLTVTDTVIRLADMANIPNDPRNLDRQQYETWLDEGGVPEPAEIEPGHAAIEQIEALEREHMLPKATREFMLTFMEATAIQRGAGEGKTPQESIAELRAGNPGYRKVKELDEQIDALREQI